MQTKNRIINSVININIKQFNEKKKLLLKFIKIFKFYRIKIKIKFIYI